METGKIIRTGTVSSTLIPERQSAVLKIRGKSAPVDDDEEFPAPPLDMNNQPSVEDQLDDLADLLKLSLENTDDPDFFGICHHCRQKISGDGQGCTALGNVYHIKCYVCVECAKQLTGHEFYCVNNTPFCEVCYVKTLESCHECGEKITHRILRAVDVAFHPECFKCCACENPLDGVQFTVDALKSVHCVECYQMKFSPRCASCQKLIMPSNDRGETVHIVSMQKNFHVQCYKCEDCKELLSSEEGRGCYPLDGHLLCQQCNGKRVQKQGSRTNSHITTDL